MPPSLGTRCLGNRVQSPGIQGVYEGSAVNPA